MRPPYRFETRHCSTSQQGPIDFFSGLLVYFFIDVSTSIKNRREIDVFFNLQDNSDASMADTSIKPIQSCLLDNWHNFL